VIQSIIITDDGVLEMQTGLTKSSPILRVNQSKPDGSFIIKNPDGSTTTTIRKPDGTMTTLTYSDGITIP